MDSPKVIALRAGVVFALLASMPLLVLPGVVSRMDAVFYRADETILPRPRAVAQASDRRSAAQAPRSVPTPAADSVPMRNAPLRDDVNLRIQRAQTRLQELGASYMLLEAAGHEDRVFHFHCRMPLGESQAYSQPFDASGRDPAATMEQVVAAVEGWRSPVREVQTAELPRDWR